MTFEELLKQDAYGAFEEFRTVRQMKEEFKIPKDYHEIFNNKCVCGSEMIISETLATLTCCNPRCPMKLGFMLHNMLVKFGCKNIGPKTCETAMFELQGKLPNNSHIDILYLKREDLPHSLMGAKGVDYIYALHQIRTSKGTIGDYISKLGFPGLDKNAKNIFEDSESIVDFICKVKEVGSIQKYLNNLGIEDKMKIFYFDYFLYDMALIEELVKDSMRKPAFKEIPICITGYVSPNGETCTKGELIEKLNDIATLEDGTRLFNFSLATTVNRDVNYVVADYPTSHRKYKKGEELGLLVSSTRILELVMEVVNNYEQS